jgi:hypothetical protein
MNGLRTTRRKRIIQKKRKEWGKYLGPTEPGVGSVVSHYVLMSNGQSITNMTIRKLVPQVYEDKSVQKSMEVYDRVIAEKLGDVFTDVDLNSTTTPMKKSLQ